MTAQPEPSTDSGDARQLAGVHLPGSGRLRFVSVTVEGIAEGDWVAIESPHGVEAARITVTPELLTFGGAPERYGRVLRRLDLAEIERTVQLADEALAILTRLLPEKELEGSDWSISGLRFTLRPERAIVSWHGKANSTVPDAWLRQHLDLSFILENDDAVERSGRPYGGLGRLLPQAASIEAIIQRRFEAAGSTSMPAGWPRLSSRVMTPHGAGTVVSVSTKHRQATVKLTEDGNELSVPLGELKVIG